MWILETECANYECPFRDIANIPRFSKSLVISIEHDPHVSCRGAKCIMWVRSDKFAHNGLGTCAAVAEADPKGDD